MPASIPRSQCSPSLLLLHTGPTSVYAWPHDERRAEYVAAADREALPAIRRLAHLEGIIRSLQSAHAVAV